MHHRQRTLGILSYGVATVVNAGQIIVNGTFGVQLLDGGTVANSGTFARITGHQYGVYAAGASPP